MSREIPQYINGNTMTIAKQHSVPGTAFGIMRLALFELLVLARADRIFHSNPLFIRRGFYTSN